MVDEQTGRSVGLALRRVLQSGREMQAALSRGLGLRVTDVQAMDLVTSAGPMGTVELGDRLGIRSASAVALVDRLVQAGHLHREVDPTDRRRVRLVPTAEGRATVRAQLAPMLAELTTVIEELDEDQAATVLWFLERAATTMYDYATPADWSRGSTPRCETAGGRP